MTRAARGLGLLAAGLAGGALLDTLRAAAAGWRPEGAIETLGLVALLSGAALLAAVGAVPRARRAAARRAPELLLLIAAMGLGLAALEWAAARVEPGLRPAPPFHTRGALREEIFHADPEALPGLRGASRYTTLASGVRAAREPAPGEPRALCIGGSTTECVYLDDSATWPALLGDATGWWVGNVGISGFDTRDHLRFARESPLLAGVGVLVIQAGINDLWRALAGEEETTRWDRFEPATGAGDSPPAPRPAPLWARSRLAQLWHTLRAAPPAPLRREGVGGLEYRIRRERRAAAVVTGTLPPLDAALAGYRDRLHALVAACRARGVTPVLSTQAVLWDAHLPPEAAARCWFGWLPDGRYLALGALREAMDAYNAATIAVARETGTICVDLADLHGNPDYFYDDCHFTPAGAREVARRVAGAMPDAQ
jgi:lysophospholipase L1-like esterase